MLFSGISWYLSELACFEGPTVRYTEHHISTSSSQRNNQTTLLFPIFPFYSRSGLRLAVKKKRVMAEDSPPKRHYIKIYFV